MKVYSGISGWDCISSLGGENGKSKERVSNGRLSKGNYVVWVSRGDTEGTLVLSFLVYFYSGSVRDATTLCFSSENARTVLTGRAQKRMGDLHRGHLGKKAERGSIRKEENITSLCYVLGNIDSVNLLEELGGRIKY